MTQQKYALAICRVSSLEQVQNNSLNRQRDAVIKAAKELDLHIPNDGWWSGNVSSKKGVNISRLDLKQILERCKKERRIKYLIVDEVDRFMRSMLEIGYFLIEFQKLGVKVIFASQPNLKTDTATDTLLLMLEAFKAEGSNEERQRKSISGQTKAVLDGRYPFSPKPGYKGGVRKGIPDIHPIKGPALQKIMIRVVTRLVTPPQGLVELNNGDFIKSGHSPYKMDKFRKILTDPFYAGIIEIDKQVKVRNERGLHDPLITKDQHYELVRIMSAREKNQKGPRKNGNPEYPLSNHTSCDFCKDKKNGRYVGFTHSNGKGKRFYHKYRCRSCGRYITREDLHYMVMEQFKPISKETRQAFLYALNHVWKDQENQADQTANRIQHKITTIEQEIANHIEAIADPTNASIKKGLLKAVEGKERQITTLETELEGLKHIADRDKGEFLEFAFDFIDNIGDRFLDPTLSQEHRVRCKLILFPAGFHVDAENKVYTPQISPIYGLASNKKDLPKLEKSLLVRVRRL